VRLAEIIDEGELRAQLDHARTIRSQEGAIWLAGNTFYGKTHMFSADFIRWSPNSDCRIRAAQSKASTSCTSTAVDPHHDVEIPALAILNELRSRSAMKGRGRFELDVLFARAKAKL